MTKKFKQYAASFLIGIAVVIIAIASMETAVLAQDYPEGMVSYWRFEEGYGKIGLSPSSSSSIENPIYVDSGQNLGSLRSFVVALGDIDGDSDLDAFVQNQEGPNKVWLNDGNGVYFDSGQEIGYSGESIDLYDLDGDSDLDAVIITHRIMSVWFNDGNGNFTNNQTTQLSNGTNAAIGDLDKDGDPDLYVTEYRGFPNKVYLNDGNGNFNDSGQNLGNNWSVDAQLGDLDCDGDLDAFVANYLGGSRVWFNDGKGFFTGGPAISYIEAHRVKLGYLNEDEYLDAFITVYYNGSDHSNRVFFNDGYGNYTASGQKLGNLMSSDLDLGDIDKDGDIDAFVPNIGPNKVWLNDGNGTFIDSGQDIGNLGSHGVSLGDLDKDGDLDAFVANYYNQPNKVWLNTIEIKVEATIDIDPNTLNKKSKGIWMTCYIELPEGNDVNHIDLNTVELEYDSQIISAERGEVQGNLFMTKFSRQALINILESRTGNVELKVSGKVAGTLFEGTDIIRVK